jgi:small subunit ribosomal protein S14
MGIKKLKPRDKKKRSNIELVENKQQYLRCLKHNKKLKSSWWSRHKLSSLIQRKMRNRCIITGRGKAVIKYFKLSRIELSRWIKNKKLPGLERASW